MCSLLFSLLRKTSALYTPKSHGHSNTEDILKCLSTVYISYLFILPIPAFPFCLSLDLQHHKTTDLSICSAKDLITVYNIVYPPW